MFCWTSYLETRKNGLWVTKREAALVAVAIRWQFYIRRGESKAKSRTSAMGFRRVDHPLRPAWKNYMGYSLREKRDLRERVRI